MTHLFHSVVFALLFVAGASTVFENRPDSWVRSTLAGVSFGIGLWLVAAGVITPMWLRAVGIPTVVLHLPLIGLLAHGIWGVVLGYVHVGLGGRFG